MSELNSASGPAYQPSLGFDYFQSPKGSFWNWVEEGKVVEWHPGNTICYREDLAVSLRSLAAQGLPPLAPALLLLAACADTWPEGSSGTAVLRSLVHKLPGGPKDPHVGMSERQVSETLQFMGVVRGLPAALRQGVAKAHLLQTVFSAQVPLVAPEIAGALLDDWASGRLDSTLRSTPGRQLLRRTFFNELDCLVQARQRFPNSEILALHLRTGLDQLPPPLPEPSAPAPPAPAPTDLLDQLAQDARTAGLARLTLQLVAALRIPLHARGAGDQPIGGVADITNRGNFDRLLLSELAHDDLSLVARLVNNEALYLRREAPPQPDVPPRTVLLDTTLRLWGVPRVFALAAALAWARNSQRGRPPVPVAALALGGQQATPLDLETFDGVVAALGRLDPAPHAGPALLAVARTAPAAGEGLLITEASLLHQPEFARALAEASPALRFLLTVARSGELQLFEYQNGHRTLASTARYDLAALLFAPVAPGRRPLPRRTTTDGPAFWQYAPPPLYLPVTGLRMSIKNTFYVPDIGVLAIVSTGRVLFWADRGLGARELLPQIEPGSYCFGSDGRREIYVLVSGPQLLRVYTFIADNEPVMADLSAELNAGETPAAVVFKTQCFYVSQPDGALVFDCEQWQLRAGRHFPFPAVTPSSFRPDFGHLKRHVNNGYTVLQRINRLEVNGLGELVIEGHELRLISHSASLHHGLHLMSIPNDHPATTYRARATLASTLPLAANAQVLLRHFSWPDGSTATADARGLLHLRSADARVPEISVLLVLGKPTAVWAADGTVCGPDYFTGPDPERRLTAQEFLQQYLHRFIAHLG